jgi:hypothetical protein
MLPGMGNNSIGYRDLDVWQQSMKLVELIFELTDRLPENQRFGLVSHMQRASISLKHRGGSCQAIGERLQAPRNNRSRLSSRT